jgi:chaperonin GroEL
MASYLADVRLNDTESPFHGQPFRFPGVQAALPAASPDEESGTTTATLMAHALLTDGARNVTAGAGSVDLNRGLKAAVEALRLLSRPVTSKREKAQVATISAHNHPMIGDMITEAVKQVGADGAITVEESKTRKTVLEIVEGMQFARGYISPYFVTDPEAIEAALEHPFLLIHEKRISNLKDLLPRLEQIVHAGERPRRSPRWFWSRSAAPRGARR